MDENLKNLSDKSLKADILEMLRKHQEMWKGHLGEVKATTHCIDLEPGVVVCTHCMSPYLRI